MSDTDRVGEGTVSGNRASIPVHLGGHWTPKAGACFDGGSWTAN